MPFLRFLSSIAGRANRVIAGLALIAVGIAFGGGWYALAAVGPRPPPRRGVRRLHLRPLGRMPFTGNKFRAACKTR